MHQKLRGMSLIELLVTVSILAVLTATALPTFRGLQARQSLRVAQRSIQSLLYRMQEKALAPPIVTSEAYDVVGYGLAFHHVTEPTMVINGCTITAPNDFLALYKIIRKRDSSGGLSTLLNPFGPGDTCEVRNIKAYPNDFYLLPGDVTINASKSREASTPPIDLPWLLIVPIHSTGESLGDLPGLEGYELVLPRSEAGAIAALVLEHTKVRVGNDVLARSVCFSRTTNAVSISARLAERCE